MSGIIDGKNVEVGTMPLDRLAEELPSAVDLTALEDAIQAEEDARVAADAALQGSISGITDSYVLKTGSVAESINGAKTFTDTTAFSGDVTVQGNLAVSGNTTTVASENLVVTDNIIMLNNGESADHVTSGIAGIAIDRGTGTNFRILFDDTADIIKAGFEGSETQLASVTYVNTEISNNPAVTPEVIVTNAAAVTATTNVLTTVTSITNPNFTVTLGDLVPGISNLYTIALLDGTLNSLSINTGNTGLSIKYLDNALPTPIPGSVYILTVIVAGTVGIATGCLAA